MSPRCRCGATWDGTTVAHCGTCHHTFTAPTAFDAHRRGGTCNDPTTVGLVQRDRVGYTAWGSAIERTDHQPAHPQAMHHNDSGSEETPWTH